MALSVINQPTSVVANLSAIVKIHKYKRLHEGHHFILMAMEVHGAPGWDMDCFIRECAHLFQDRCSKGHLSLSFCIQLFRQSVSIAFQHALTFTIKRKIAMTGEVYSRPPLLLDLTICMHATLKGPWVRLPPTTRRTSFPPFSWFLRVVCLLACPFCLLFYGSSQ
jgi:hypothetical protein